MIVAEELEADWSKVRIEQSPTAEPFNNPLLRMQMTAGSSSVRGYYDGRCGKRERPAG